MGGIWSGALPQLSCQGHRALLSRVLSKVKVGIMGTLHSGKPQPGLTTKSVCNSLLVVVSLRGLDYSGNVLTVSHAAHLFPGQQT